MFSPSYVWNELRRRIGRTIVTAIGLAAGVGLVIGIIGVSDGLSDAQNKVLSPLSTVGTDIIITRTVAPTTSTATTTTTTPAFGGAGAGAGGGGRGGGAGAGGAGGFFGRSVAGAASLNSSNAAALASANSSVITDLAKLGKPGTQFTHDFFVPGTLITFPSAAIGVVAAKIPGVATSVGALSLQALHETGTVPTITDTVKTGGQTLKTTVKPPVLTAAQTAAERTCIQGVLQKTFGSALAGGGASTPTKGTSGTGTGGFPGGGAGSGGTGGSGTGSTTRRTFNGFASNPALAKCLTPAQISYQQNVTVPEQTIERVLNPPTTNIADSTYTVAGVDPANTTTGLITKAQLVSGTWFTASPADEVLVARSYASTKKLTVGSSLTINSKSYKIVGLVNPTLTGDVSDIYFDLSTLQTLSTSTNTVNEVLVSVNKSQNVDAIAAKIRTDLPGAQVLTDKSLADSVTGSLANAHKLATDLGGALAIVVLLAAFLIAGLLTLSSVAKRTREIGSLRAIGWSRGAVVRQIIAETLGIGVIGAVVGVALGVVVCAIIGAVGPGLTVQSTGLTVGASTVSNLVGQSNSASVTSMIHLTAPIHATAILLGVLGALVGGLLAGQQVDGEPPGSLRPLPSGTSVKRERTHMTTTTNEAVGPIYQLSGVERSYTKGNVTVHALRGIDLTVQSGEMIALEGPSGSGKSTLLQLLGALDVPSKGAVRFAGRELEHASDRELTTIRSEQIGFVFQQFNLIPTLSAEENVAVAMVPRHIDHATRLARAVELLDRVGLGHRHGHLPSRLSGGEQQRVAIARALANSPRVVIVDEPTGNLDSETAGEVMELINELHQSSGVTVVLATHDEDIANRATRRIRLRDGKVVSDS